MNFKKQITDKKKEAKKRRFSSGSLNELEELLEDIYEKLENINNRLEALE